MRYIYIFLFFYSCQSTNLTRATSPKAYIDPRDGERYGYVQIGDDIWMTENMRYNVEGSLLNPNNPNLLYGRLYNWKQAIEVCPKGWRLSTDLDWIMLEKYCVPEDSIFVQKVYRGQNVKILKSKKNWSPSGTDSLSMNILPAGWANYNGFHVLYEAALFWTSDSHYSGGALGDKLAYYRVIVDKEKGIYYDAQYKKTHLSCRCVRNAISDSKYEK